MVPAEGLSRLARCTSRWIHWWSAVRSGKRLVMSWVISTDSLHGRKVTPILPLSLSMSSKRISSTVGSSRLSVPADGPGPSFLPARAGERKGRTAWRGAAVSASVAAVMARDTGSAWSARSRVIDPPFHLPNLIRLYWRLLPDPPAVPPPQGLPRGAAAVVGAPFR